MQSKIIPILKEALKLFIALHIAYFLLEYLYAYYTNQVFEYKISRTLFYALFSIIYGYWAVNRKEKLKKS